MAPTLVPQRVGWGQKLSYEQPNVNALWDGRRSGNRLRRGHLL